MHLKTGCGLVVSCFEQNADCLNDGLRDLNLLKAQFQLTEPHELTLTGWLLEWHLAKIARCCRMLPLGTDKSFKSPMHKAMYKASLVLH